MSDFVPTPFLQFLEAGVARGGFEADDVLSALLPLMKQVQTAHEQGLVAPLRGTEDLLLADGKFFTFDLANAHSPKKNATKIDAIQAPVSVAVEVVGELRRTADVDDFSLKIDNLKINATGENITRPVFVPDYGSWEHAIGHHDELTDIFSLGQLLASLACGLDFSEGDEFSLFVNNRTNLFSLHHRLNPVLASVIGQMTELNRHKRAPDLAQMIARLENYREQPADLDFARLKGFKDSTLTGKRRLIQSHLRDRLFEISHRNRLIYFKPTLQTLNLTVASVPLVLDYRNIKLEQLFVWHPELAATVTEGSAMSLGKYLRFEDAPYLPGVLDKIISEARRDRAEYGFAQLRLVLCFLRWHNLKEEPTERIHSPLLLLPVELSKKKGVRDNYVLEPTTSEAEVNPALRHHFKELYNLNLPEFIDLRETSLDQFYDTLKAQIQATEPGVTLNKIDRPQIELIHEKARQRVDQYRHRMKMKARANRPVAKSDYSYDRENFRPLGLQLFLNKIRPAPLPLRQVAGAKPESRQPNMLPVEPVADSGKALEVEKQTFALREGNNSNPYAWDFDLCSLTLGNFQYRKMTLVRDYAKLIETDMSSKAFDTVFALTPRPPEEAPPAPLPLTEQHLIISCDASQASAIARARTGASYIIQGPPGTGKSQTITNLIADYVARGKRVLFVCEKRAAIDIVFHRLRQQGLDELCCLIHDSQTDKKAFIQNLKQTYEKFLSQADADPDIDRARTDKLRATELELSGLRRFSEAMKQTHETIGLPFRRLLHRLVEISGSAKPLSLETEDALPDYALWLQHGELVGRLRAALEDLGEDLCFARHPLRWLGRGLLESDRPLETLTTRLAEAEQLLDTIESALEMSGLPGELWDTFEEIRAVLDFASRAQPLAERDLLPTLMKGSAAKEFEALSTEWDEKKLALTQAREKASGWRDPLAVEDAQSALQQAKIFEKSFLRFLQPAFWRLKKTLQARYDFSRHAVAPSWTSILSVLAAQHEAQVAVHSVQDKMRKAWRTDEVEGMRRLIDELRADRQTKHPSVKALIERLIKSDEAASLIENLTGIRDQFNRLDATLQFLLAEHQQFDFPELSEVLGKLREQTGALAELLPVLTDLPDLPEKFGRALRHVSVPLNEFEGATGQKSVNGIYRLDRSINRFDGRTMARKMEQMEKHYREWLGLNARAIRSSVRRKFLEHVSVSSLPAAQLDANQKIFKKTYASGRRDLEHEFGKTMRYKSIRDLAADHTGAVIQDLKPIWLMSPLSVSDTLPLDPNLFDVVIFDEASQIPMEEAVPAIYRSHQAIVVGDQMQLPPTTFFAGGRSEEDSVVVEEGGERIEVDLDADSFLTQSSANLPSTLLSWHYRSRYESLISFSNAAFYSGNLFTIPDRQRPAGDKIELRVTATEQAAVNIDALLARSVSFHLMENGVYQDRTNASEAAYIAQLVRGLLQRQTGLSIGVVAFSEAQQGAIEDALARLAEEDSAFAAQLEAERGREENDQFCGLFVKNLENVQGDERDIILMSVCYGRDPGGRMLMNFGPINQRGGEKRLNVIFSRAKHHMALVSSIRHDAITNDYNDGANSLKNFLQYAEATSCGDEMLARRVLENLNPLTRKILAPASSFDAVVTSLAAALQARGHVVDRNVGQSKFRCDLAVRDASGGAYQLGILIDTEAHYTNPDLLDRYLMQPSILRAFGWSYALVLTKDLYQNPDEVMARLERLLAGKEAEKDLSPPEEELPEEKIATVVPALDEITKPIPAVTEIKPPSPPEPPVIPPANEAKVAGRLFEFIGGTSRKFWEITLAGNSITVRFGRIGTVGMSKTKTFADEARAALEVEALIAEKVKKGYVEK